MLAQSVIHAIFANISIAQLTLITGAALSPPAYEPVATFPIRVLEGKVQVKDDRWD